MFRRCWKPSKPAGLAKSGSLNARIIAPKARVPPGTVLAKTLSKRIKKKSIAVESRWRLTRNYSIASLIGIAAVGLALGVFYRTMALGTLEKNETQANASLSQALANTIWPKYGAFITAAGGLTAETLAQRPEISALYRDVRDKTRGLRVAKIKIYDRGGLTVFSTDRRQIGKSESSNPGLRRALAGETASLMVFRQRFDAWEQVVSDRNLLQTYVPFRYGPNAPIQGVFELYTDITPLLVETERTGFSVIAVVTVAMLILYLFLLAIVRRADRLLAQETRERQIQQARIQQLAYYDGITGLPNRAMFLDLLQHAIDRAKRSRCLLGLMFIDIDRFKAVNDRFGHSAGDRVLAEVARRVSSCVRDADTVCRIGGDEFTVILENLSSPEMASAVARRILQSFARSVSVEQGPAEVTVSIGCALLADGSQEMDRLVRDADAAMYRAKELGRNRYVFHGDARTVEPEVRRQG